MDEVDGTKDALARVLRARQALVELGLLPANSRAETIYERFSHADLTAIAHDFERAAKQLEER